MILNKNFVEIKTFTTLFEKKIVIENKVRAPFLPYQIATANKYIAESLKKFTFQCFYQPYSELLLETMNKYGFTEIFEQGILDKSDKDINGNGSTFKNKYDPNSLLVNNPYPAEEFTFKIDDPYAQDNWFTFYHLSI